MAAPSSRTTRAVADRLRRLRNGGQIDRYLHQEFGVNSRLDEMQAAVLRARLPFLREWTERRRALARRYRRRSVTRRCACTPERDPGHVYHLFTVRSPARDALMRHLEQRGIGTIVHYPISLPAQPASRAFSKRASGRPSAPRRRSRTDSAPRSARFPCIPGLHGRRHRSRRLGSERLATGASVRTGIALMLQTVIASLLVAYLPGALAYRVPIRESPVARRARRGGTRVLGGRVERVLVARGRPGAGWRSISTTSRLLWSRTARCPRLLLVAFRGRGFVTAAPRRALGLRRSCPLGLVMHRRASLLPLRRVRHRRQGSRHVHQRGRADRAARQSDPVRLGRVLGAGRVARSVFSVAQDQQSTTACGSWGSSSAIRRRGQGDRSVSSPLSRRRSRSDTT